MWGWHGSTCLIRLQGRQHDFGNSLLVLLLDAKHGEQLRRQRFDQVYGAVLKRLPLAEEVDQQPALYCVENTVILAPAYGYCVSFSVGLTQVGASAGLIHLRFT